MTDNRIQHSKVGSWFLGPQAENFDYLREMFHYVLERQKKARKDLYPQDPAFITPGMQKSDVFQQSIKDLQEQVKWMSDMLATHSIPFWSPRYNAHMNMDTCMSGIIGYMAAMMYNPNNVATEASPFTTLLEKEVGDDLCKMLGYRKGGWGHITCDGSVANLEAIWAARNLKFYPLSLKLAMKPGKELAFLTDVTPPFNVKTCQGTEKAFNDLTTWELLNLTPLQVLCIPSRLYEEYGISPTFLQTALGLYSIQTVGMEALEKEFNIKTPAKFFVSATKHYSWPKGGAITGLGSMNFVDVKIDRDARMDINCLKKLLDDCISPTAEEDRTPVFGVVAIMGSTEHGACDPLEDIVRIREEYEQKGLSFVIHCDAAWGGYFRTALRAKARIPYLPNVPTLALKEYTQCQLWALNHADSITIDPHKSGYINYPAGGLCYRNERMKYLITWTSPIVYHSNDAVDSMGVYGVEGSKPGASAAAVWLTHRTLGLEYKGYGRLLGEAIFTCTKLYCYWITMTMDDPDLIVVPLNMLPEERHGDFKSIRRAKEFIRDRILAVSNEKLMEDEEAKRFLNRIGSDLMINAFACNFKIDGKPNTDVGEANYLNTRIFKRLSVTTLNDEVKDRPLFLTESKFTEESYGDCLRTYKQRLELGEDSTGDLVSLVNVTMSPWPTDFPFMRQLAESFKEVAKDEAKRAVMRNKLTTDIHGFIMQGSKDLFLVHLPMFNMANHRRQLIVKAKIPDLMMQKYRELRDKNPSKFYTVANIEKAHLRDFELPKASFKARMDEGIPGPDVKPLAEFDVTIDHVVISESLWSEHLDTTYPEKMPFYLYGNGPECHIDHVLKASPNAQLNSDCIAVSVNPPLNETLRESGVVVILDTVFERSLQPMANGQILPNMPGLNFQPSTVYKVKVFDRKNWRKSKPIATGEIQLGGTVYADWHEINMDPADQPSIL